MIIDTDNMEHDFETLEIDGLFLVNPSEIGVSVAHEMLDNEKIEESDIYDNINLYLSDIVEIAINKALQVLEENKVIGDDYE